MGEPSENPADTVPARFRRAIVLHLVSNWAATRNDRMPLLLGVHGPPGNGKTFQTKLIAEAMGARVVELSSGSLEDKEAGEPVEALRKAYLAAAGGLGDPRRGVLLINDIDAALGDWGPLVQTTVNRQMLCAELMQIADRPCSIGRAEVPRTPIIMTGNYFGRLYGPMIRAGRAELFEWSPNFDERLDVLTRLFPELPLEGLAELLQEHDQPVAFFADAGRAAIQSRLWRQVRRWPLHEASARAGRFELDPLDTIRLDELADAARRSAAQHQALTHD